MRADLKNGTVRAVMVFALVWLALELLFWILQINFGIEFFADTLLALIGAGWLAYYVWRKTEVGYY